MRTDTFTSGPNGNVPNSRFPVLIHRGAVAGGTKDALSVFRKNFWLNNWENHGIYTYGHFHSTPMNACAVQRAGSICACLVKVARKLE